MSVTPVQTKKPNFLDYRHERKIDRPHEFLTVSDWFYRKNEQQQQHTSKKMKEN